MHENLKEIASNTAKIISGITRSTASAVEQMHLKAMARQKAQAAQQACCEKYRLSIYIQHDLTCAIAKMTPPQGLTLITDPRNLIYMPDLCLSPKCFAFFGQKSSYLLSFDYSALLRLKKMINHRLTQFCAYLSSANYSVEFLAAEYPAFFHGFRVADIRDEKDGIILVVEIR